MTESATSNSHNVCPPSSAGESGLFAGIDVGGTNIKIGVVSEAGTVVAQTSFETQQEKGADDAMRRSADALKELCSQNAINRDQLVSVGLGTPGPLNIQTGMILNPSNLPAWHDFPIRESLATKVDLPVSFCNDANAAAMGEFWIGGGQQFGSMILLTLGTGIGGGIVINDFLIEGAHSLGGECGHVTIDSSEEARLCGCGSKGHLEAYASATAVVERFCEVVKLDPDKPRPTAKDIGVLASKGDIEACQIVIKTADYLARGIAIFAHVIDPEAIILGGAMDFGGAMSPLGERFLQRLRSKVSEQTFGEIGRNLRIEFATLGGDAGWIGAAAIARRDLRRDFKR